MRRFRQKRCQNIPRPKPAKLRKLQKKTKLSPRLRLRRDSDYMTIYTTPRLEMMQKPHGQLGSQYNSQCVEIFQPAYFFAKLASAAVSWKKLNVRVCGSKLFRDRNSLFYCDAFFERGPLFLTRCSVVFIGNLVMLWFRQKNKLGKLTHECNPQNFGNLEKRSDYPIETPYASTPRVGGVDIFQSPRLSF